FELLRELIELLIGLGGFALRRALAGGARFDTTLALTRCAERGVRPAQAISQMARGALGFHEGLLLLGAVDARQVALSDAAQIGAEDPQLRQLRRAVERQAPGVFEAAQSLVVRAGLARLLRAFCGVFDDVGQQ